MYSMSGMPPEYLPNYFVKRFDIHGRKLRDIEAFDIPGCRLSMGQRAFYYQGIISEIVFLQISRLTVLKHS